MKKVYLIILSLLICTSSLFCKEWDIYDGADKDTLKKLAECDKCISQGQFLTAWSKVGGCENEYIIYKYVELCTQYYAKSIMHTSFGFVNLKKGQTLHDVRISDEEFTLPYTSPSPEDIINLYKEKNGDSLVLQLALANYYYDGIRRYKDLWFITPEEVIPIALKTYETALKKKVYDEIVLENLAQIYTGKNDFASAEGIYEKLTAKFPKNGTYWYNYTVCLMQCQKYEKAIGSAQQAVDNPEATVEFHYDAYMILSDAYCWSNNGKDADRVLREAIKKYPDQPGAYIHLAELCFFFPANYTKEQLNGFLDSAVKLSCTDNTIYSCINLLYTNKMMKEAIDFCERNIKTVKDNNGKGLLYYYLSQFYFMEERNREKTSKALDEAKKYFKKSENYMMETKCDSIRKDMLGE